MSEIAEKKNFEQVQINIQAEPQLDTLKNVQIDAQINAQINAQKNADANANVAVNKEAEVQAEANKEAEVKDAIEKLVPAVKSEEIDVPEQAEIPEGPKHIGLDRRYTASREGDSKKMIAVREAMAKYFEIENTGEVKDKLEAIRGVISACKNYCFMRFSIFKRGRGAERLAEVKDVLEEAKSHETNLVASMEKNRYVYNSSDSEYLNRGKNSFRRLAHDGGAMNAVAALGTIVGFFGYNVIRAVGTAVIGLPYAGIRKAYNVTRSKMDPNYTYNELNLKWRWKPNQMYYDILRYTTGRQMVTDVAKTVVDDAGNEATVMEDKIVRVRQDITDFGSSKTEQAYQRLEFLAGEKEINAELAKELLDKEKLTQEEYDLLDKNGKLLSEEDEEYQDYGYDADSRLMDLKDRLIAEYKKDTLDEDVIKALEKEHSELMTKVSEFEEWMTEYRPNVGFKMSDQSDLDLIRANSKDKPRIVKIKNEEEN